MQIVNIIVYVRKFFQDILTYCILVDLIIVRSFPVKRTIPAKHSENLYLQMKPWALLSIVFSK